MNTATIILTIVAALIFAYAAYGIGASLMAFGSAYPLAIVIVITFTALIGVVALIIPLLSFGWVGGACLVGGLIGCWHGRQQLK